MRKRIGILLRPSKDDDRIIFKINDSLRTRMSNYNVDIILLCPSSKDNYLEMDSYKEKENLKYYSFDKENMDYLLNLCDGIILPGGYGPYDYDLYVTQYAYEKNIPTLGICLGMQVMGLVLGGRLDFISKSHLHNSRDNYVHAINIRKDTLFDGIIKENNILVNSRHNEEVLDLDTKYISATLEEVIEVIEDRGKKYFLGVQWHPEDLEDEYSRKIFDSFIESMK